MRELLNIDQRAVSPNNSYTYFELVVPEDEIFDSEIYSDEEYDIDSDFNSLSEYSEDEITEYFQSAIEELEAEETDPETEPVLEEAEKSTQTEN